MADQDGWTVTEWLRSFGFEKYVNRFVENGYETRKLCSKLKAEDLDEMQITEAPHRSILFNQSDILRLGTGKHTQANGHVLHPVGSQLSSISPESPTTSVASSDLNSETYSTVFDDISSDTAPSGHKPKPKPAARPASTSTKKSTSIDKPKNPQATATRKTSLPTGKSFKLHPSALGNPPKTKLELKMVIRDFIQRDTLNLTVPPYCNESGSPNVPALAELAESYSDELNIESLLIMDALEDVWRYKINESSENVIPKSSNKFSNVSPNQTSSATSTSSFVFQNNGMYSEPFDSKPTKPSIPPKHFQLSSSTSSHSSVKELLKPLSSSASLNLPDSTGCSAYLDPYDAIDGGSNPVIVKTSPSPLNDKKKPAISPKLATMKGIGEPVKETLKNPDSPSLSVHSSSSEDTNEKSPKIKKSWVPFRRSQKSPDVQKRKLKKRLSGSMEALDERGSLTNSTSRQSMPPQPNGHFPGLPRSISSNPALLYQESLVEDLRQSKKKFGGSHGSLNSQYSPKAASPIASHQFFKANTPPASSSDSSTKSRIKSVNLSTNSASELELSSVLEVYVSEGSEPVYFKKAQTIGNSPPKQHKSKSNKSGIMARLFKTKDKKPSSTSIEEEEPHHGDNGDNNKGLTSSHSLPDIQGTVQANVHSEYTELYDLLEPKVPKDSPPELPSRNRSHDIASSLSPQSSPPTHHKLMVKSDSTSSSEIIHSLPSSGDDVIEIRNPTSSSDATAMYNEPWTHIPINRSPSASNRSPGNRVTSRRSSSGSSTTGSPRKPSLATANSPIRRRKLFEEPNNTQTLPNRTTTDIYSRKDSMRMMTLDESFLQSPSNVKGSMGASSGGVSVRPSSRPRFLSIEDLSASMFLSPPPSRSPKDSHAPNSDPLYNRRITKPKLRHTESSPGVRRRDNILEQLKRTGISFEEGISLGFTPPVSPDHKANTDTQDNTGGGGDGHYCEVIEPKDSNTAIQMKKLRSQSKHRSSNKNRNRSILELRVESQLESEGIDLATAPYSNMKGEYGVPVALVTRYAQDVGSSEDEVAKTIDSIRRINLIKSRQAHIPLKKDWRKFNDISTVTLDDFLVSIGLPQYRDVLMDNGVSSVDILKTSSGNERLKSLPVKESHKKHIRVFIKRL